MGPERVTTVGTLADALGLVRKEPWVVITGSLYLAGEALELLGLGGGDGSPERQLNEWTPVHAP